MALGGGTFIGRSKILPGAYVNFVSLTSAGAAMSERGVAAFPFELDWGRENEVFAVTASEFLKNSMALFGYEYADEKLKGLRDLFRNARMVYVYRLGKTGAEKASNAYGTAKYAGIRGNMMRVAVSKNADGVFTVRTIMGTNTLVDTQTVKKADELRDSDFVVWNKTAVLNETGGTTFQGGKNPTVALSDYQAFLSQIENYPINAIGACVTDAATKDLFVAFIKNLRDNVGIKMQCVLFQCPADHEGIVNVYNPIRTDGPGVGGVSASLVYWVTGAIAGCAVNKSNLNKVYDGEFDVFADYPQALVFLFSAQPYEVGRRVLLIREQGGQAYYCIGCVGSV